MPSLPVPVRPRWFMTSTNDTLRPLRDHHRLILAVSVAVLVLSFVMGFNADRRLTLPGLAGAPLPPLCASRAMFNIRCPGCGLTRSFVALAAGDWAVAWQFHRLGWLVALGVAAQVPYRIWGLVHPTGLPLGDRWPHRLMLGLLVLLVFNWMVSWWV
ncbi:MAG: DUF2752 domain-containing protein [Planctomycetaceae bacterium]